ncbi:MULTISPECIES: hypothetical protein [Flavobacterium]|uniref:Uncharacterized protein n=1 Tax=Flavobacterium jumunjinense TaxID=998845 RepID=A0ABV5GRX0_9FLAO|nr:MULTISPECIES: hypothetical protein [Flavobacterium]
MNYELGITDYGLRIGDWGFRIMNYGLGIGGLGVSENLEKTIAPNYFFGTKFDNLFLTKEL